MTSKALYILVAAKEVPAAHWTRPNQPGAAAVADGIREKETLMWIVYLVVILVGVMFGALSLISLEAEA